jgi:aspartyl-tRNA synthetase
MSTDPASDPHDLAVQQALLYAEELRELYRRHRETAEDLKARNEATRRIRKVLDEDGFGPSISPSSTSAAGGW